MTNTQLREKTYYVPWLYQYYSTVESVADEYVCMYVRGRTWGNFINKTATAPFPNSKEPIPAKDEDRTSLRWSVWSDISTPLRWRRRYIVRLATTYWRSRISSERAFRGGQGHLSYPEIQELQASILKAGIRDRLTGAQQAEVNDLVSRWEVVDSAQMGTYIE